MPFGSFFFLIVSYITYFLGCFADLMLTPTAIICMCGLFPIKLSCHSVTCNITAYQLGWQIFHHPRCCLSWLTSLSMRGWAFSNHAAVQSEKIWPRNKNKQKEEKKKEEDISHVTFLYADHDWEKYYLNRHPM